MFFVKPLYNGTEDGMFGHPAWDAITWCPRVVGFRMTTRTAAWSLGMTASPGSQKHWSSSGSRALQP